MEDTRWKHKRSQAGRWLQLGQPRLVDATLYRNQVVDRRAERNNHFQRSCKGKSLCLALCLILAMAVGAAAEKTRLVIGHYFEPGSFGTDVNYVQMSKFIEEFQKLNPDIEVVNEPFVYDVLENGKMLTMLLTGTAPTVWLSPNTFNLNFAAKGMLMDLTRLVRNSAVVKRDFIEPVIQSNADREGRIWGFPQGLQPIGLFYHTERFQTAGVPFPNSNWTWDDFAASARRLTQRNADGVQVYGAMVQSGYPYTGWALFRSFGGQPFDATGTKSTLTSDAMRKTIEFMSTGVQQQYFRLMGWLSELRGVAMGLDQYVRVETLRSMNVPFNVTTVPKGPAGRFNPLVANSWVVTQSAPAKAQEAAWKWIEYYSGTGPQKTWALLGDAAPANMTAIREVLTNPTITPSGMRDFIFSIQDADWIGNNPVWDAWYLTGWAPIIDKACRGEISPQEAMIQADLAAQVALDSFYKKK